MTPISTKSEHGTWTRVNRNNPNEKSVIDYVIMPEEHSKWITENIVDEQGTMRIKGRKESDHNTMLVTIACTFPKESHTIKRWKLNNTEGWTEFNTQVQNMDPSSLEDYDTALSEINKIMEKTVGCTKVSIGVNPRSKESEETKEARRKKKQAKSKLQEAIRYNLPSKTMRLTAYMETQKVLRNTIAKAQQEYIKDTLTKIRDEGGTKSQTFWKLKRKITDNQTTSNYMTTTEDGTPIEDPVAAKCHIADYYENLYQARESRPEYTEWTEKIKAAIERIEESPEMKEAVKEIETSEIKKMIKKLKRGKATGPDDIPNEIFTEAQPNTVEVYKRIFNNITRKKVIPKQWQEGQIIRLYKGKGKRGKCSNERGITLSSNVGKLFERIINERAATEIRTTENQAGGKKGTATADHLMLLKETIREIRKQKKPVYMVFLDVTKAYDKAWLDAIMYVMYKEGLKTPEWDIIKKLNENITARIKTKYGITREINIKDSIRQGGVLSVNQYALLMDEISKEIDKQKLGTYIPSLEETIGCLLWMDDVVLISSKPAELQKMLDITYDIACRYHIEFGKEKSKAMKIGGGKTNQPEFRLGDMILEYTDKYKYLGEILNNKNNMTDHISATKGKVEAAYQTILTITGNSTFKEIEMQVVWELVECCITAIITYGAETWYTTKTEMDKLNKLMDNIIKRILMVPQSTPREALYMETGLLDPETIAMKNRIMLHHRLATGPPRRSAKLAQTQEKKSWGETTTATMILADISDTDLEGKKNTAKRKVSNKIKAMFKKAIEEKSKNKSKVNHLKEGNINWKPQVRQKYMETLTRDQVSLIFKAKSRMLDIKNNFRNKYTNLECRACGKAIETQSHVLEMCEVIHKNDVKNKITHEELFQSNPQKLKEIAKRIKDIMTLIQCNSFTDQVQLAQPRTGAPLRTEDVHTELN